MAEKISMIIILVDLDCHKCHNKMRKILCHLQDCERIRTISFDDKSKTITIVGPFDPHRLACKLRCKAGKVIRDIHIVENGGGGKPPPSSPPPVNNGKHKHKEKPPPPPAAETPPPPPAQAPEPVQEMPPPPSPSHHQPPPDREMSAMVPAFVEEKKPRARPAELELPQMSPPRKEKPPPMDMPVPVPAALPPPQQPEKERYPPPPAMARPCELPQQPVEYVIPTVEIPSWPAPPVGPCGCPCCAPCYQGYYERCRCCCCGGRAYAQPLPLPAPAGCVYRGCRTFSDEDPSAACSIM